MLRYSSLRLLFLLALLAGPRIVSLAQSADAIEHIWYDEEKTAKIQIYKATDGKYYGKIAWLKVPDKDGKPKIDSKNPDKAHQNDPLMGLLLLKGFKKNGTEEYNDGTIYDPTTGKTYSCKMTLKGSELSVRGFVGFSLIGKSTTWTKAD